MNKSNKGLTIENLITKQSVRATFSLPQEIIDLLGVLAGQLGIKQKTLLDQLSEDVSALEQLAAEARKRTRTSNERRQKTFVMSRRSLHCINNVAKQSNIPRDTLVEVSIQRLLPIIENEREKHRKRKKVLSELQNHLLQGEMIRKKTRELLGEEDVLFDLINKQVTSSQRSLAAIEAIIEKGAAMEDW